MDSQQPSPGTPEKKSIVPLGAQVPTPPSTKRKPAKAPPKALKIKIAARGGPSAIPQKSSFSDVGPSILDRRNTQVEASDLADHDMKKEPECDEDDLADIKQEPGESPVVVKKKFSKEEFMKLVKENLPSNEYCCIARNPFYRGEVLDGPYYEWLRDSYYKGDMPEIIRRCNKFRGFPQLDDEEANPAEWELYAEKYATEEWQKEFEPYQKEIDLYLADPGSEFNVTKRRKERAERRAIRRRLAEFYGEPYDEEDRDEDEEQEANDGNFAQPPYDSPHHDPNLEQEPLLSASLSTGTMVWTPYDNSEILGSTAGLTPKLPQHIGQAAKKRSKRPYKPRKTKGRRGGKRKRDEGDAEFVDDGDDSDSEVEPATKKRRTARVTRSRAQKGEPAAGATEAPSQHGPEDDGNADVSGEQTDYVKSSHVDRVDSRYPQFSVQIGTSGTRPRWPGEPSGGWTPKSLTENPWQACGLAFLGATGAATQVSGVGAENGYADMNAKQAHGRISPGGSRSRLLGHSFTSPDSAFFPDDNELGPSPLTSPAGPFSPLTPELPSATTGVDDSLKSSSDEDDTTDNENEFSHLANSAGRSWLQDRVDPSIAREMQMTAMAATEESIYS